MLCLLYRIARTSTLALALLLGSGCRPATAPATEPAVPTAAVAPTGTLAAPCPELDEALQQLSQAADAAAWAAQSGIPLDDGCVTVLVSLRQQSDLAAVSDEFPDVQFTASEVGLVARIPIDELCALAQSPQVAGLHLYAP